MCCFSGPPRSIRHVSGTHIFARSAAAGRQFLVYSMNIAASRPVAMILPLPVPAGSPEDAVRFIDLSGYPTFFVDMDKGFPPVLLVPMGRGAPVTVGSTLTVHKVGRFEASLA